MVLNKKPNLIYPPLDKPILQSTEEPILQKPENIVQPKTALKFSFPGRSRPHDKFIPLPQTRSGDDSKYRTINRESIQNFSREIPAHTDPLYRPLLNQLKYSSGFSEKSNEFRN